MKDNEIRSTGSMPILDWFLSLFVNKYKRRIEVARWKANIRLIQIDQEMNHYWSPDIFQKLQKAREIIVAKIDLLDSLLKGKEIRF